MSKDRRLCVRNRRNQYSFRHDNMSFPQMRSIKPYTLATNRQSKPLHKLRSHRIPVQFCTMLQFRYPCEYLAAYMAISISTLKRVILSRDEGDCPLKRWKNCGNRFRQVVIWDMDRIDRLFKFLREDTRNGGVDLDMVNMRADESAF